MAGNGSGGASAVGGLGLLLILGFCRLCGSNSETSNKASVENDLREFNARQAAASERAEEARLAALAKQKAELEQQTRDTARLKALKSWQRAEALHKCSLDSSSCPFGGHETILEATASPAERATLAKNWSNYERITQAAEEANAPKSVKCCDGTLSPSCMCGRASLRGCCSHHHGVCGCE